MATVADLTLFARTSFRQNNVIVGQLGRYFRPVKTSSQIQLGTNFNSVKFVPNACEVIIKGV